MENEKIHLRKDGRYYAKYKKGVNENGKTIYGYVYGKTKEEVLKKKEKKINSNHKIAKKLKELYKKDKEALKDYTKILYAEARMIEGLPIENPTELASLICEKLSE